MAKIDETRPVYSMAGATQSESNPAGSVCRPRIGRVLAELWRQKNAHRLTTAFYDSKTLHRGVFSSAESAIATYRHMQIHRRYA